MWFVAALVAVIATAALAPLAAQELEAKRIRRQVEERERAKGYAGRQ